MDFACENQLHGTRVVSSPNYLMRGTEWSPGTGPLASASASAIKKLNYLSSGPSRPYSNGKNNLFPEAFSRIFPDRSLLEDIYRYLTV